MNQTFRPTCSSTRAYTQNTNGPIILMPSHCNTWQRRAEIMTWAERAADVNQMRRSDLKGREGGTRAELDKLKRQRGTQWGGLSDIHIKS